jgi:carbon-monoxide dehydrogenase small subunit
VSNHTVDFNVNGQPVRISVEPRKSLADVLREDLALPGTKLGCEQGACGACTVLVDGDAVRSCLMFGVQAEGASVETIESLAADGELGPIQQAFRKHHALQCGFCTPGFVMSVTNLIRDAEGTEPSEDEVRLALGGNICRCTGYHGIVAAARELLAAAAAGGETSA